MLNLILGEELLPFSVLSTSSTIYELKYGREKRIKIHYKEKGKAPEIKSLTESAPHIGQISEFVHVKSAKYTWNRWVNGHVRKNQGLIQTFPREIGEIVYPWYRIKKHQPSWCV